MKFLIISTPLINWKISDNSPSQLTLSSLPGYCLLNPVDYSKAYQELNLLTADRSSKLKGNYLITTAGLLIKQTTDENFEAIANKLFDYIALLFRYIRFESMHLGIKPNNHIHSISYRDKIKKGKIEFGNITAMGMYAPRFNTMISWSDVVNADKKLGRNIKISIAEEIFIDALDALLDRQFDKTILFSAIAIESLLANFYDTLYDKKLSVLKKDRKLRIVKDHKGVYKDPIFKALIDRTDFKKLLHEVPMYLMKKSIFIENEPLYHSLLKLYNTRNKIVHWGAPLDENENERIPLTEQGANKAFDIALDTFKWMKISRFEILRNRKGILIE